MKAQSREELERSTKEAAVLDKESGVERCSDQDLANVSRVLENF